jgi:hypothetical protein
VEVEKVSLVASGVSSQRPARVSARGRRVRHTMGCVQSGVEGYFVPPVAEDESPDLLTAAVSLERLPSSARTLVERLRLLSALFLAVAAYFVVVSALTETYDHVGPAGIALLQAALVRRAAVRCAERTPVHVAHLRACFLLFLTLTVSKGVATLASASETRRDASVTHCGGHDHEPDTPSSSPSSTLLINRLGGGVPFANLLVLAALGYLTYVAFLCFSRLEKWCLVVLFERRWAQVLSPLEVSGAARKENGASSARRAEERAEESPLNGL